MPRDLLRARVELGCAGCELLLPPRQSLLGCRELGRAFLELRPVVRSLGDLRLDRREPVALGAEQAKPAAEAALAELELALLSVELALAHCDRSRPFAQALLQLLELFTRPDEELPPSRLSSSTRFPTEARQYTL